MIDLLCKMNRNRKTLIEKGVTSFSEKVIEEYEKQYHNLITEGRKQKDLCQICKKGGKNTSEQIGEI